MEGVTELKTCLLVSLSVYETKNVHFLSIWAFKIIWITKEKAICDKSSVDMMMAQFLYFSINNVYNKIMNKVYQANQLCGNYRPDCFLIQFKRWWSIYFCAHGTFIVSSYCVYNAFHLKNKRKSLSCYGFWCQIVLAKIDPENYSHTQKSIQITSKFKIYKFSKKNKKRQSYF